MTGGVAWAARRLILLRHGQTLYNAERRMQGQLDTDLSEIGERQAERAGAMLALERPRRIITSDLRRAAETADAVARRCGLKPEPDVRLRETHLGEWQGMTHTEVDAQLPGARSTWRDDPTWRPPGGESRLDVADRAEPLIAEMAQNDPRWGVDDVRPIVFVAHGGLVSALTARLLELPVPSWPMFGGLGNASWVVLTGHGPASDVAAARWRLDVWNASAEAAVADLL